MDQTLSLEEYVKESESSQVFFKMTQEVFRFLRKEDCLSTLPVNPWASIRKCDTIPANSPVYSG